MERRSNVRISTVIGKFTPKIQNGETIPIHVMRLIMFMPAITPAIIAKIPITILIIKISAKWLTITGINHHPSGAG
ncbi:MAG: hypothetical protein ACP5OC_05930 [Thermoplasmata archaeon]